MAVRASEILSLRRLYRELGYEVEFKARHGTLYHSTRRWSESYADDDGNNGQSMTNWSTAKGRSDLEKLSQKFLDAGYGNRLWPPNSNGSLEYPRDQKRLAALLAQLFWNQHTNIVKADRRRSYIQQCEMEPSTHVDIHAADSSIAQDQARHGSPSVLENDSRDQATNSKAQSPDQDIRGRPQLNAGTDRIHAAELYAIGRARYALDALKPLHLNDRQASPVDIHGGKAQSARPPRPTHHTPEEKGVYDFYGSDDETEAHNYEQSLIVTLKFTLNSLQYQKYTLAFAKGIAPIANMTGLPGPPVAPSIGAPKRPATSLAQVRAVNGIPKIMRRHAHDKTENLPPKKALKGKMNISGPSLALIGPHGAGNIQQRTFDVPQAPVRPAKEAKDEEQIAWGTPREQTDASNAPSEVSVIDDNEDDETYTPGKPSEAKQNGAKRPKATINKSKAAKKRRLGPKSCDDNQKSSFPTRINTPESHLSAGPSPIATGLQAGLDNAHTSLISTSEEHLNKKRSIPSTAHTNLEGSVSDVGNHTEDLKEKEQELTQHLGTDPSTAGLRKTGDDRMHMDIIYDVQKSNTCHEDGSHGNPILIPEESPSPVEYRSLYPTSAPWESEIAATTKAIRGTAGTGQPLAPLKKECSAKIEAEQNGLPYYSTQNMLGREGHSVSGSRILPRYTPKVGRVLQSPQLPYSYAIAQSGSGGNNPPSPPQGGVSTGGSQGLDWARYPVARSRSTTLIPQDTKSVAIPCLSPYSELSIDTSASSDKRNFVQNEEDQTKLPKNPLISSAGQDEGVHYSSIRQSSLSFPRTTQPTTATPPCPAPKSEKELEIAWWVVVYEASGESLKHGISGFKLDDMTLASILNLAVTGVPVETEIRNITLTIRSYTHKRFPKHTERVDKVDEVGFNRIKREFIDSVREYAKQGVKEYQISLEVNPKEED